MADNPFLLPDGSIDILAVTNHSRRSDTPIEGEVTRPGEKRYRFGIIKSMEITRGDVIEGEVVSKDPHVGMLEEFGKIAERDLIKRVTPIEGEVVPPSAREQGLKFMLNAMKEEHRNNPRRPVLEGEVITPADEAKERSDNAAMIVEVGLAVLATGNYVALSPIWDGSNVEKEVKDITALQIEKKD